MLKTTPDAGLMAPLPPSYDSRTIHLHWVTAALVIALWCLGETIDWFPKGDARIAARGTHICLGIALALVFCIRIGWRLTRGQRLAGLGNGFVRALSTSVHYALYGLIAATVTLGIFFTWVRGDNLFNLWTIPPFDPGNKPLRAQIGDLHALFANVLISVAALHAAAGLTHHFVWRDDVLRRMLPRRWRG